MSSNQSKETALSDLKEVNLSDPSGNPPATEDEENPTEEEHPLLDEEASGKAHRLPPALLLVYLSVFIDAFGGLMAIPVLPQIILKANAMKGDKNDFGLEAGLALGLLSACYQFFSVPSLMITTRLADIYGRRPFFMLGFLGSAVGFLIMAFHNDITPMLISPIIGRSIGGIFSASPPLAHGYISDLVGPKSYESAVYRSYLGSIFMFALIFAPGFGGGLSQLGLSVPFFVSAGLATTGLFLSFFYLQESMLNPKPICGSKNEENATKAEKDANIEMRGKDDEGNVRRESTIAREGKLHALEHFIIKILFIEGACLNGGFRIFIMMGPLWLNKKFGWGAAMYGFATSMVGCVGIFINIKIYPKVLRAIGKHGCCVLGPLFAATGFLIVWSSRKTGEGEDPYATETIMKGPVIYMLGMCVISFGNALCQSSLSSLIARYTDKGNQSGIQGKYRAMQAVTGFAAPLIGGALFDAEETWNHIPAISAAFFFLVSVLARLVVKLNHDLHHIDPKEHDIYPTHTWCEILPGIKNPLAELHHKQHKFIQQSHPTAVVLH